MRRLLLDTNIYGELLFDESFLEIKSRASKKFVIHGFKVIREELRDVPKRVKTEGKNLRISLLHIYDELTKRSYNLNKEIKELADKYYEAYRQFGGSKGYDNMHNDLLIVACAVINQIDIVVSEDNKSMLTENALKAYKMINSIEKRKDSGFVGYLDFKRWLI